MKKQFSVFLFRWFLNAFGLWLFVKLFGTGFSGAEIDANFPIFLIAGLIFSFVNAILKPLIIILSLPAILLTLGLFMVIVNGVMVYVSLKLAPGVSMTFGYSILTGIVLSLINYIVSSALEFRRDVRSGGTE